MIDASSAGASVAVVAAPPSAGAKGGSLARLLTPLANVLRATDERAVVDIVRHATLFFGVFDLLAYLACADWQSAGQRARRTRRQSFAVAGATAGVLLSLVVAPR